MALYEMVAVGIAGHGILHPIRLIAESVNDARMPFAIGGALRIGIGFVLHIVTSGFWGHKYGRVADFVSARVRSVVGTVGMGLGWGLVVWLLMGLIVGPTLDPALRDAQPVHYFVGHVAYGVKTALAFRWLSLRFEDGADGDNDHSGSVTAPTNGSSASTSQPVASCPGRSGSWHIDKPDRG